MSQLYTEKHGGEMMLEVVLVRTISYGKNRNRELLVRGNDAMVWLEIWYVFKAAKRIVKINQYIIAEHCIRNIGLLAVSDEDKKIV